MNIDENGKVDFVGIPKELEYTLSTFSDEEKRNKPLLTLQVVIRCREQGSGLAEEDLPTEYATKTMLKVNVRHEDPSQYYNVIGKIAVGAFSKVFEVERKSDQRICALKFCDPKSDQDRENILNEVGIMLLCKDNDGILQCLECFEFKEKLWIFIEMMDGGALTEMLEKMPGKLSEQCCKYVCLKVLKGLKYLHDRHILHRDIKSDNVLISTTGSIKLADFGYATQLTLENKNR